MKSRKKAIKFTVLIFSFLILNLIAGCGGKTDENSAALSQARKK